jgi:hypothetical protein
MAFKNKPKLTSKGIPYNYKEKECKRCGKTYKPMTNVQKYCCLTCQNRVRRERHKEKINKYNYEYAKKNKEKTSRWKKKHDEKPSTKERKTKYMRELALRDINFKIRRNTRSRIYSATKKLIENEIRRKYKININYLKIAKYLKGNLPADFHEKKYHIDHIKPLCSFDLTKEDEFKRAFAPENHRWLLAIENLKKGKEDRKLSIRRRDEI